MKVLKIKTTLYQRAGVTVFPALYSEIVSAILKQPDVFSAIPIEKTVLENSVIALRTKTNKAHKGSETDKTQRRIQAEICLNYLFQLGAYVLQVASKEPTLERQLSIVQLSKFILVKLYHEPTPALQKVSGVSGIWTGKHGQALIEWDRIKAGAYGYNIYTSYTSPAPDTVWNFAGTTACKKLIIDGLPHLGQVWVCVRAVGKRNQASVASDAVLVSIRHI